MSGQSYRGRRITGGGLFLALLVVFFVGCTVAVSTATPNLPAKAGTQPTPRPIPTPACRILTGSFAAVAVNRQANGLGAKDGWMEVGITVYDAAEFPDLIQTYGLRAVPPRFVRQMQAFVPVERLCDLGRDTRVEDVWEALHPTPAVIPMGAPEK